MEWIDFYKGQFVKLRMVDNRFNINLTADNLNCNRGEGLVFLKAYLYLSAPGIFMSVIVQFG